MAEYKLGRIKFVYQGNWVANGTSYAVDDVVTVNGKTYICVLSHTSSPLFATDLGANPTCWNLVADGTKWVGTWANSTYYQLGDLVQYGGYVYQCTTAHTSASTTATLTATGITVTGGTATITFATQAVQPYLVGATITTAGFSPAQTTGVINNINGSFTVTACTTSQVQFALTGSYSVTTLGTVAGTSQLGLEADSSKWATFATSFSYNSAWTINTRYKANDIVSYGGFTYVCNAAHVSANTYSLGLEQDQGKWTVFNAGITYLGLWSSGANLTGYISGTTLTLSVIAASGNSGTLSTNQILSGGGVTAGTTVTASLTGNGSSGTAASTWTVSASQTVGSSGSQVSITAAAMRYRVNDIVRYGADLWICTQAHNASGTALDATKFTQFVGGFEFLNSYNSANSYVVGDLVTYGGYTYACIQNNSSTSPQTPSTATSYWQVYTTGFNFRNDYTVSASPTYKVGDVVRLGGYTYLAIADNASNLTPPNATYWTVLNTGIKYNPQSSVAYSAVTLVPAVMNNSTIVGTTLTVGTLASGTITVGMQLTGTSVLVGTYIVANISGSGAGSTWTVSQTQTVTTTTITGRSGTTTSSGSGATFNITRSGTVYSASVAAGGSGYAAADSIKIYGTALGGISPANDATITVSTVGSTVITGVTVAGYSTTWYSGGSYVAGDVTFWGASSYVCVSAHTAGLANRPDADTSGTYWNLLASGTEQATLTTQGDMFYYGSTGPTRLPIGTDGQILRVNNNQPVWQYYGQINNVVYVSPTGSDTIGNGQGTTIDKPWQSIRYACQQVEAGYLNTNAGTLLSVNKQFMMKETAAYVTYNYTFNITGTTVNGNPTNPNTFTVGTPGSGTTYQTTTTNMYVGMPIVFSVTAGGVTAGNTYYVYQITDSTHFNVVAVQGGSSVVLLSTTSTPNTGAYVYSPSKAERDAGLVIEGANFDLTHSGTYQTTKNTNSFFSGGSLISGVYSYDITPFVSSLTYLKSTLVPNVLSNTAIAQSSLYQTLNNGGTFSSSTMASQITNSLYTSESGSTTTIQNLITIVTNALTAQTNTAVPAVINPQTTISVKTGTYNEILPINVPAYTAIVGDELRSTVVQPFAADPQLATVVPKAQAALTRIQGLIPNLMANTTITPSTGNTVAQVTNLPAASTGSSVAVTNLQTSFNILYTLVAGGLNNEPVIVMPQPTGFNTNTLTNSAYGTTSQSVSNAAGDTTGYGYALTQVRQNYQFIIADTLQYLSNNYAGVYNLEGPSGLAKGARDITYILDSILYDLTYGGNTQSLVAGASYYSLNALQILTTEKAGFVQMFQYMATIVSKIAQKTSFSAQAGNSLAVNGAGTAGSAASGAFLFDRIYNVLNYINNGTPDTAIASYIGAQSAALQTAYNAVAAVNTNIASDATVWVSKYYQSIVFSNSSLINRDALLITNALNYDMVYGSNFNAIQAGRAFNRANTSATNLRSTASGQLPPTLGAINFLYYKMKMIAASGAVVQIQETINDINNYLSGGAAPPQITWPQQGLPLATYTGVTAASVTGGGDGTAAFTITRISNGNGYYSFYVVVTTPGTGYTTSSKLRIYGDSIGGQRSTNDIVLNVTQVSAGGILSVTVSDASATVALLEANRAFLLSEVIAYINTNYSSITTNPNYSVAKTQRDAGFVLDAIHYDLTYGGNWQSQEAGMSYYSALYGTQIASGLQTAFVNALNYISTLAQQVIVGTTVSGPLGSVAQVLPTTSGAVGSTRDAGRFNTLMTYVLGFVTNGLTNGAPIVTVTSIGSGTTLTIGTTSNTITATANGTSVTLGTAASYVQGTTITTGASISTSGGLAVSTTYYVAATTSSSTTVTLASSLTNAYLGTAITFTSASYSSNNTVTVGNSVHGLVVGDIVIPQTTSNGLNSTVVGSGQIYYVLSSGLTTTQFQLSTSYNGSAQTFTSGSGLSIPVQTINMPYLGWTSSSSLTAFSTVSASLVGTTTTTTMSAVTITGTTGTFSCTSLASSGVTIGYGNTITVSGTLIGTGNLVGYANPTTYYVVGTNGSSTFTLSATSGGPAITTVTGSLTGLTFVLTTSNSYQAQVNTYVNTTYPALSYNSTYVQRDTVKVTTAAMYDMLLGSNFASVTAGRAYNRTQDYQVLGYEKTATIAALNYLQSLITASISSYLTQAASVVTSTNLVIAYLNKAQNSTTPEVNGTVTYNNNLGIIKGAEILRANIPFLASEANAYLNSTYTYSVTSSSSSTNAFTTSAAHSLNVNDPVQFSFSSYTISIASATGTTITTSASMPAGIVAGMPIVFSAAVGVGTGTGVQPAVTYYVKTASGTSLTVSQTNGGATAISFTTQNGITGVTATAGGVFGGINSTSVYYVASVPSTTTFTITSSEGYLNTNTGSTYPTTSLVTATGSMTVTYYAQNPYTQSDITYFLNAIIYDLQYTGNYRSLRAAQVLLNSINGSATSNMWLVRNACGIRNMTMNGLTGYLTNNSLSYGTKRPTGGAYTSLDPGFGPNDSNAWVYGRSCYVQNCTMFGYACYGAKVDGALHAGGYRSMVSNDYTCIIGDGIGWMTTGAGSLSELVSVFNYYSYAGYMAELGGRIRATNGNSSYGTYGVVAEGADTTETPIYANVNNRAAQAQITNVITDTTNQVLRLEYGNAGSSYSNTVFSVSASGVPPTINSDEFRDASIFETRIIDTGTSTNSSVGGTSYVTASNTGQASTIGTFKLSATDTALSNAYNNMRITLTGGTGVGQFANILTNNNGTKICTIVKDSFAPIIATASTRATFATTGSSISGTTLTIGTLSSGTIVPGAIISGGAIPSGVYIVANLSGSGSGSTWTVSQSVTQSSTAIAGTVNLLTTTSTANLYINMPIYLNSAFDNLSSNSLYYVLALTSTQFTLSSDGTSAVTLAGGAGSTVTVTGTAITNNLITATNTLTAGQAITFASSFNGIDPGTVYFVSAINLSTSSFAVSLVPGGPAVTITTTQSGLSITGTVGTGVFAAGWDHVVPGNTTGSGLTAVYTNTTDLTTTYTIEPRISYTEPGFNATARTLPALGTGTYGASAYGAGYYVAIANGGTGTALSTDGKTWAAGGALPGTTENWIGVVYGGGSGAVATALLGGLGGTGAVLQAVIGTGSSASQIVGITIINGGYNYTTPPTINIVAPSGYGTGATATCQVLNGSIVAVTMSINGSGYTTGVNAPVVTAITSVVTSITMNSWGKNYFSTPTVTISQPQGLTPTAYSAGGAVTNGTYYQTTAGRIYLCTQSGTYSGTPTFDYASTLTLTNVTLGSAQFSYIATQASVGTGITLTNYGVSALTLSNTGYGYTSTPTVTITDGSAKWVAVSGSSTTSAYSTTANLSSPWTSSTTNNSTNQNFKALAYGGGTFVAVGGLVTSAGTISKSTDGVAWVASTISSGNISVGYWASIAYGNGFFVAIQNGGTSTVISSNGGATFIVGGALPSVTTAWTNITYGNGRFVAVSSNGTYVAYSLNNGTNWTLAGNVGGVSGSIYAGLPNTQRWGSVAYGEGQFVAVANMPTPTITATAAGSNLVTLSSSAGLNVGNSIVPTQVTQTGSASLTTHTVSTSASTSFISNGTSGQAGTIFTAIPTIGQVLLGQQLTGSGVTAGTYISAVNSFTSTGSSISGTALTTGTVTGTVAIGQVLTGTSFTAPSSYITANYWPSGVQTGVFTPTGTFSVGSSSAIQNNEQLSGTGITNYATYITNTLTASSALTNASIAPGSAQTITGSISGTVLTVSANSGNIQPGYVLSGGTVASGTYIVANITGTPTSASSTWYVSVSQTATCTTATPIVLTMTSAPLSGTFVPGMVITGGTTSANTFITTQVSGTAGTVGSQAYASGGAPGASTVTLAAGTSFAVGQLITGTGLFNNTYITSVNGAIIGVSQPFHTQAAGTYVSVAPGVQGTYNVTPSQTITSQSITGTAYTVNTTTLVPSTAVSGNFSAYIVSGSGSSWTINQNLGTIASSAIGGTSYTVSATQNVTGQAITGTGDIITVNSTSAMTVGEPMVFTSVTQTTTATAVSSTGNLITVGSNTGMSAGEPIVFTAVTQTGTLTAATTAGNAFTLSSSSGLVSGESIVFTAVTQATTLTATTHTTSSGTSYISGTTLTVMFAPSASIINGMVVTGSTTTAGTYISSQLTATNTASVTPSYSSGGGTGTSTFVVNNGTGIAIGQLISGTGIPNGTYVGSTYVTSSTTVPLVNANGVAVTFTQQAAGNYNFFTPGQQGTYAVSISQTVASSGSPATLTFTGDMITVSNTSGMIVGESFQVGTNVGNLLTTSTYYITKIIGNTLAVGTTSTATSDFTVSNTTSQSVSVTAGAVFGGITSGVTYYLAGSPSGNNITLNTAYGSGSVTVSAGANGAWTFVAGATYGNLSSGSTYYIINPTAGANQITVSTIYGGSVFNPGNGNGAWTTVAGGTFGGMTSGTTYFISEVLSSTQISIVTAYGGTSNFALANTAGSWTFVSGAVLGNLTSGATYYIASISGNNVTLSSSPTLTPIVSLINDTGSWTSKTGTNQCATSWDSVNWTARTLPSYTNWSSVVFGNPQASTTLGPVPLFVAISGTAGTVANSIRTGARTLGRTKVASNSVIEVRLVEPGSGYPKGNVTATTVSTNVITADDITGLSTSTANNQPIEFNTVSSGGLSTNVTYYVIGSSVTVTSAPAGTFQVTATPGSTTPVTLTTTAPTGMIYQAGPVARVYDPNHVIDVGLRVRMSDGVLGNPSFATRGTNNTTATATTLGDGYSDLYQNTSSTINVNYISTYTGLPAAGANVQFASITGSSQWYKLVSTNASQLIQSGTGNNYYTATFTINPSLTTLNAPVHGTLITTRLKYSQVRLTGHDFLYIGTGNQTQTNYPNVVAANAIQANQQYQTGGGRVFFTSTDQDGNFNVGNLFGVQQSTGTATLNASAFNLAGLQSLTLNSVNLGVNSATITSFSTDPFFVANSDNILPTQKAIKSYITAQIGGGQSTLNVNTLTAGQIKIQNDQILNTAGNAIQVTSKMVFTGGIDGAPVALVFFGQK